MYLKQLRDKIKNLKERKKKIKDGENYNINYPDFSILKYKVTLINKELFGIKQEIESIDKTFGISEMFNIAKNIEKRTKDVKAFKLWKEIKKLLGLIKK